MAVSGSNLTTAGNNADATSYNTASVSPTANALVLLWVYSIAGSAPNTPTVTGAGLTWVQVDTVSDTSVRKGTLFRAMGASPSSGALTIDFGGQTQTGCAWSVSEYTGVDTSGTNGSGAIVQDVTNFSSSNVTGLTVTLSAFSNSNNATFGAFGIPLNTAGKPDMGSGFTEIGQVNQGSPNLAVVSGWKATNDTSVDGDWSASSVPAVGIGVEIKAFIPLIETLTDDFNDNSFNTSKWTGSYGTISETGGRMEISCTSGYSGFISNGTYDLTGSYMFAEITRPSIGIGTTQAYFQLNQNSNNGLIMLLESTNLTMRVRTGGSNSDTSITYNATDHKWWRIRESGGSVYFDTSPDGLNWTNRRTVTTPSYVTSVAVDLSSGYYGAETSPTPFILDNFNIDQETGERYWVGGTDTWDATAGSKWAYTSGGAGGAPVPTATEDVFFNASSTGTITLGSNRSVLNLDFTGFTGTLDMSSYSFTVAGTSLVLGSGMTLTATSRTINMSSNSPKTIDTNGVSMSGIILAIYGNGACTLLDDIHVLQLNLQVSFDANDYDVTIARDLYTESTDSGDTLSMGSGTWEFTGYRTTFPTMWLGGITIAPETSTVIFSDTSSNPKEIFIDANDYGGNVTFYNFTLGEQASGGYFRFSNSSSDSVGINFTGTFTVEGENDVRFRQGRTYTFTNNPVFTATGAEIATIKSDTAGSTRATFNKASGTVDLYNLDIQHMNATGATWNAFNSINSGNNNGWNFSYILIPDSLEFSLSLEAGGLNNLAVDSLEFDLGLEETSVLVALFVDSIRFSLSVDSSNSPKNETPVVKRYRYKVYDPTGTYITDWDVSNDLNFDEDINSAGGQVTVTLPRNLDATGEELDLKFKNIVKVYMDDMETNDSLVYQGEIVNIIPSYGEQDKLQVVLFTLGYLLDYIVFTAEESVEQSQDAGSTEIIIGPDSTIAQSFIPDQVSITSIEIKAIAELQTTNLNISIRTNNSGTPSATIVTGSSVQYAISNQTAEVIKIVFDEPLTVTPATTYWLVVGAS